MINVLLRTSDFRGDHSADIAIAIELIPGETAEHLAARVKLHGNDWLEIRTVQPVNIAAGDQQ